MQNPHHSEAVYWRADALAQETQRVLDVCHGCRRCWNVCPSFGNLFKRIDEIEDAQTSAAGGVSAAEALAAASGNIRSEQEHAASATADPTLAGAPNPVDALGDADRQRVVDECYQCKLCYNLCPYHPPHRYQLDFPRLMQRHKAVAVQQGRGRWRDKLFAQVDLIGRLSCAFAPLVNWLNRQPWHRRLLRLLLGVHPKRDLPLFHRETFRAWWDWRGPEARGPRVALFYTCSVDYNEPKVGKAAVAVLEKNGFEVVCPEQRCCGMPHLDGGDIEAAKRAARRNLEALVPLAQQGVPIIALGPTCSLMLRDEYPALLRSEEARLVARQTYDVSEFLIKLKKEGRLNRDFAADGGSGTVAYQAACHLKAQNIGFKAKELLELLPASKVTLIDRCSAHDGTWSMKEEYFELSMKAGAKLFREIEEAAADVVATDCPLAGIQITQATGRAVKHPVELVAAAYGLSPDPS